MLIEKGVNVNGVNKEQNSALTVAAMYGNISNIFAFIVHKTDVLQQELKFRTNDILIQWCRTREYCEVTAWKWSKY